MKAQLYCILTVMVLSIGTLYAQRYQDDLYRKKGEIIVVQKQIKPSKPIRVKSENALPNELVESYDEALQRRMEGYLSTNEHSKEFWDIQQKYVEMLAKKYDETFYNILVVNDQTWVEPRYITSMFDNSDPVGDLSRYAYNGAKSTSVVRLQVNVVDPWYSSWYAPRYSSWNYYGWRNPYWGGGYSPYWGSPYWGGGYYPSYWGGGYYPSYWGGGYYPSYWGGGYYPSYWGGGYYHSHWGGGYYPHYQRDTRPRYYGGNYYNSRNTNNSAGNGFGRPSSSQSRPAYSPMGSPTNVRRYNNGNTRPAGVNRPDGYQNNRYERPTNDNRYERPTNSDRYERPTYNSRPTRESTPSYSPPVRSSGSGSGGTGGGGFGGGSRRTR